MWVRLCSSGDLAPGQVRGATAGRRDVVVVRTPDGGLVATGAKCPHRGAPLRFGRLCSLVVSDAFGEYETAPQTVLRCPWHAFEFAIDTGRAVADPKFRVQTYAVKEEGGEVLIDI